MLHLDFQSAVSFTSFPHLVLFLLLCCNRSRFPHWIWVYLVFVISFDFVSVSPNIIFFPFQRILCLIQTLNVPSHSFDRIDYDFADVFFYLFSFIFSGSSPFCVPFIFSDIGHWVVSSISHCRTEREKNKANLFCKFELSENVGKRKTNRYRQKWNANDTEIFICLEHNLIQVCCILFMMMVMMKMTVLSR